MGPVNNSGASGPGWTPPAEPGPLGAGEGSALRELGNGGNSRNRRSLCGGRRGEDSLASLWRPGRVKVLLAGPATVGGKLRRPERGTSGAGRDAPWAPPAPDPFPLAFQPRFSAPLVPPAELREPSRVKDQRAFFFFLLGEWGNQKTEIASHRDTDKPCGFNAHPTLS